jgi:DNA modification methylase
LGLEPSPELYVEHLVQIFREVRRVLRDDGTLWLNLGDSYASGKGTCYNPGGGTDSLGQKRKAAGAHPLDRGSKSTLAASGLKPKDLVGIPWRVGFALQDDGWWLRSEIVWAKRAPMPESVTDRPTRSHEKIFLLTKSARYFYDLEAVREIPANYDRKGGTAPYTANGSTTNGIGSNTLHQMSGAGRNQRDVWTLGPEPYPEAHFATFPTEIPRRAILAGTSERGCCPACGAPWERVVEKGLTAHDGKTASQYDQGTTANRLALLRQAARERGDEYHNRACTTGWRPTCACPPTDPIPCTVLDLFNGSGTTGFVAIKLGRNYIGCELNPDYIELTNKRLGKVQPLLVVE